MLVKLAEHSPPHGLRVSQLACTLQTLHACPALPPIMPMHNAYAQCTEKAENCLSPTSEKIAKNRGYVLRWSPLAPYLQVHSSLRSYRTGLLSLRVSVLQRPENATLTTFCNFQNIIENSILILLTQNFSHS